MRNARSSSTGFPITRMQAMSFQEWTERAKCVGVVLEWGSGGVRVIYFHLTTEEIVLLVMVYAKAAQANVKPKDIKLGAKL
jgi:hypothetical protein